MQTCACSVILFAGFDPPLYVMFVLPVYHIVAVHFTYHLTHAANAEIRRQPLIHAPRESAATQLILRTPITQLQADRPCEPPKMHVYVRVSAVAPKARYRDTSHHCTARKRANIRVVQMWQREKSNAATNDVKDVSERSHESSHACCGVAPPYYARCRTTDRC